MTVGEAARQLGLSLNTVLALSDSGHLSGYRTEGGHRRLSVESVYAYDRKEEDIADDIFASIRW